MITSPHKSVLFIVAHPYLSKSRANATVARAVAEIPEVRMHVLYDRYPYFHVDVGLEQELLLAHDLIVIQHPLYWYSMPALLKLWLDDVLESGWAYGPGGDKMRDKQLMVSISVGGPEEAYSPSGYNRFPIDTFLAPWDQTAYLCQMKFLKPCLLHGAIRATPEKIDDYAFRVRERILDWLRAEGRR